MKKYIGALLLAFLLTSAQARTLYVLGWESPLPVRIARVEVVGGSLVQVLTAGGGLSGTIAAEADKACLTITAEGQTTAGIAVRFSRAWSEGCDRIYMPFVLR